MYKKIVKIFLRLALAGSFLSAVADRIGLWPENWSSWNDWNNFLDYTKTINTWAPDSIIPFLGFTATILEVLFGICLLIGFKTEFFAKLSGVLLLLFAFAMSFSLHVKAPLDYSVFTASAAAFALSLMKEKYLEIDQVLLKNQ